MILTRNSLIDLLKILNGNRNIPSRLFPIYSDVYDLIHNGDTHEIEFEDSDFERMADLILDMFGEAEDDEDVEYMTMHEIECALGKRVRLI